MFEAVALGQSLPADDYKPLVKSLRLKLLDFQFALVGGDRPIIVVLAGDDRSGRHETLNTLCTWLDPRFVHANAYGPASYLDDLYPFFWRFWRDLPARGELAVYIRDWTSASIVQFLNAEIDQCKLERRIRFINAFEQTLLDSGALIVKCWLHLPIGRLAERLAEHAEGMFVDPKDKLAYDNYDQAQRTIEMMLRRTTAYGRSWHLIDGSDPLQRNIAVGQVLCDAFATATEFDKPVTASSNVLGAQGSVKKTVLDTVVLDQTVDAAAYPSQLMALQVELAQAIRDCYRLQVPIVLVFEGWDAAGKGGVIRRLVANLDAGYYRIVPVAKPTTWEAGHHYLWRFWRQLPARGQLTIFDRSWYGRVLVERVEGFATQAEWQRAYREINDFEEQLVVHDTVLQKYWLHIDAKEQAKRFKAREQTPYKRFKITDEDYRNQEKRPAYTTAVHDMVMQTSTEYARWQLIPANSKRFARLAVLQSVLSAIKQRIDGSETEPVNTMTSPATETPCRESCHSTAT